MEWSEWMGDYVLRPSREFVATRLGSLSVATARRLARPADGKDSEWLINDLVLFASAALQVRQLIK